MRTIIDNTIFYNDGTQVEIDTIQKPVEFDEYGNRV